jgi:hypothetical protein
MKTLVLTSAIIALVAMATTPARAKGPYCDGYCAAWVSCTASCWTEGGLYLTTCGEDGYLCGICHNPTTFWWGTGGPDTYNGTSANNYASSGGGDDTLYGAAGNDRLIAGDGNDTLFGDSGDDCLLGENGNDSLNDSSGSYDYFNGGAGTDTCSGGEYVISCP